MKLDKDNEIEFCQEYKYLGVIFDTGGTDDKEIRSRVIQARKCIACLNGILWSKDIRKERKLNIYKELINLLRPNGYVMHQQFNIQQLYALPALYLCVLYLSENKQRLVPLTA